MKISTFNIQNQRSIKNAFCELVPRLMIIAGPNGAGKSTLLNALKQQYGGQVLYVGPHRNSRRQQVQYRSLISHEINLEKILMQPNINNNIEGIRLYEASRDPWDSDEALNYLKHGLCQLEIERKEAISAIYDRDGKIDKDTLPDIWTPLKELTENLLPHLSFNSIDTNDRNSIMCLWQVHSKSTIVDIDELSSGEKAIIQIFYPLIEQRIKNILKSIKNQGVPDSAHEISVLIDEPELHLHPNLQLKIFDYFRVLSTEKGVQIIITTHSPTIVEYATSDELYLLRPYELLQDGENQLIQVATNEEKLFFLKTIFGTTANLTAMQPVVVVEGINQNNSSKVVSDRKLYRALNEKFDRVTLISGGGKSECLKLIEILGEALKSFSPNLKVVGLLDKDIVEVENNEKVFTLPVSMIENFLIDPYCIWESIQAVLEKTSISTASELEKIIDDILDELESFEKERRVIHYLDKDVFRPHSPSDKIPDQLAEYINAISEKYKKESVDKLLEKSSQEIEMIKKDKIRRENYKGKEVINEFYKKYLHSTGYAKPIFIFETARHARQRKSVKAFFDNFFKTILVEGTK
ncbi:MAG: AAA family ATPase [Sphingobacteriia bacterium]|jgi:predicted ATP-dependent endonuclease of OLD family